MSSAEDVLEELKKMELPEFCARCSANMVAEHRRLRNQIKEAFNELTPGDLNKIVKEEELVKINKPHPIRSFIKRIFPISFS